MESNRRIRLIGTFIAGGVLLILAALTLILVNRLAKVTVTPTPASVAEVQRVSLADAKAAYDSRSAVFVDVRDSSSYATSHIPGALSIPLADLPSKVGELNPKSWIIPYCT